MQYDTTDLPTERVPFTGLPADHYPARLCLFDAEAPGGPVWAVTVVGPCVLLIPVFAAAGITVRAVAVWADGSVSEEVLLPDDDPQ